MKKHIFLNDATTIQPVSFWIDGDACTTLPPLLNHPSLTCNHQPHSRSRYSLARRTLRRQQGLFEVQVTRPERRKMLFHRPDIIRQSALNTRRDREHCSGSRL
ncbi:hypothetical protein EVAR_34361_1 [Eumeta japonica]|uniref:Uncharacterized protein n=1 Tax=Eumeta variegata TaxID=151549 RepID=A0A4C1ZZS2_EUMVA|nr:hypothetical protein EVAR_34361_1 [Eumeta japonica]